MKKYAEAVEYFASVKKFAQAQTKTTPANLSSLNKQPNPMAPTKPASPPPAATPSGGMVMPLDTVKGKTPAQKAQAPAKSVSTVGKSLEESTKGMASPQFEEDVERINRMNERLEKQYQPKAYSPEGI